MITTVAGNGVRGEAGDGGQALAAELEVMSTVAVGPLGEVVVNGFNRIRRIGLDGVITTIAGTGQPPRTGKVGELGDGDGGPAILARVTAYSVRFDLLGNLYLSGSERLRRIDPQGSSRRWPGVDPAFSWVTAASRRGASQSTRPTGCTWPTRATTASAGSASTAS